MARAINNELPEAHQSEERFLSAPQETYLRLLTVTSQLSHQVDQLLRTFDVTQPQFNVLRILAGASLEGLGRNEITARHGHDHSRYDPLAKQDGGKRMGCTKARHGGSTRGANGVDGSGETVVEEDRRTVGKPSFGTVSNGQRQ